MKKKTLISILLFLLLSIGMCMSVSAAPKLAKKKLSLKAGNAAVISIQGNNGTKVKWSISNKKIVSFVSKTSEQAVITAKQAGTAKVIAKVGKKKLTCQITVKKNKAIPSKLQMVVGTTYTFRASKKAKWSVSDPSLASIGGSGKTAKIKALQAGVVTVTAVIGTKSQTCEITILNKDGTKAVPKTPAATPTDQGTNQTTEQNTNQTTGQNTDQTAGQNTELIDGYPAKEVDGLYEPSTVGSYRKYWYGEVGSSYIYVLAEGNHMAPGDGLVVGVHSNVTGLSAAGAGSVSANLLSAEEVAELPDWATHYAYIMHVHANQAGNGTAVLTGSVGGQEIKCVMPIFVDRTD